MKRKVWSSAVMLMGAMALGCGDDGDDKKSDGGGGGEDEIVQWTGTLVAITADNASAPIKVPHQVAVLNSDTGKPLDPPQETTTDSVTGEATLTFNRKDNNAIYIKGVGPAGGPMSTYDTVMININLDSGDQLLRISSAGTLKFAEGTGGFTAKQDRAAVTGAVYFSPNMVRTEAVGCAKIYIDGHADPTEHDFDQRYMADSPLPATLATQDETSRRGQFYIANMTTGKHTLQVTLDEGKSFIAEQSIFVPFTRDEASSETKSVLVQVGIDVDGTKNPTPASCPQLM